MATVINAYTKMHSTLLPYKEAVIDNFKMRQYAQEETICFKLLVIVKTTLTSHAIRNVHTNIHPTTTCRMCNHDCSHNIPFIIYYNQTNYPRIS